MPVAAGCPPDRPRAFPPANSAYRRESSDNQEDRAQGRRAGNRRDCRHTGDDIRAAALHPGEHLAECAAQGRCPLGRSGYRAGAQRMIHFSSVDAYSVVDFPDGIDERTSPSMT
jgi:hypothetical protein